MKRSLAPAASALAAILASCTDPVRDRQIEALGDEQGDPGPEHRPGQPCVLCHSEGGPASDSPFAVAGTVYETSAPGSKGAEGVTVELLDANGGAPAVKPVTNRAGNFYVPASDWKDLAFPFRVRIVPKGSKPIPMTTTVNREGSCNSCHRPFPGGKLSAEEKDALRSSVGQIFVGAGP
jgi:hypothetical protein